MLNKMKLSSKLIYGFLVVAIITIIVGAIGLYGINRMGGHVDAFRAGRFDEQDRARAARALRRISQSGLAREDG